MLEPRAVKVARGVLRGLGGSNAPRLPDQRTSLHSEGMRRVRLAVVLVGNGSEPVPLGR